MFFFLVFGELPAPNGEQTSLANAKAVYPKISSPRDAEELADFVFQLGAGVFGDEGAAGAVGVFGEDAARFDLGEELGVGPRGIVGMHYGVRRMR